MKRKNLLMSLTLAGALSTLGSQAHATSWIDFDDVTAGGAVSADPLNPTVLNRVTVVCPATGFLVARATSTAGFRNLPGGKKSQAFIAFSISLEVKRDFFSDTVALQNLGPDTLADIPVSLQRVDACNSGETRTYYYVAYGGSGPEGQVFTEGYSRLVVEFFDTRI